ncbi:MAG: iron ABC transporter permease [Deltaproteobacteria bacterium]|nr:iron ABC transporter permease [Deltaproteobacteria bacterium]MBW2500279.1 iron ABC transporter permease [Deltaproteobacteria bacterium]
MIRLTASRMILVLGLLFVALVAVSLLSLASGPSSVGVGEVVALLRGEPVEPAVGDIVLGLRMPRLVLGLLVGAALATSGAVFQALLRNPLADPYVLGVSGGAALAGISVLALGGVLGLPTTLVPMAAFGGGLLATGLLYWVAGVRGRSSPTGLLLTGVVFNAFASAGIVFLASLAGFFEGSRIFLWLIGHLSAVEIDAAGIVAACVAAGVAVAILLARSLNLLALGDETASQLGVPVESHRRWLLLATSLMVGAAVAVSGLIGFVGLIVPHSLRLVVGSDHRLLIPAAALSGAGFLVLCDTVARTLLDGRELPVGAVTALVGGPIFIYLLRRAQERSPLA